VLFLAGVAWLGLSGAPDERGFWPVLLAALAAGLMLARDRTAYSETVIRSMSQPIVMLMVMAWLLAGVLGSLMNGSGFIEALVWLAGEMGVSGRGFVAVAFLVCCVVSTSTGTSLGTVLLCSPLLYPAGAVLAANPVVLIGAILGGATFGDNISPVSDTTIASAATQGANIGGVVRSRLKYALPAAAIALVGYAVLGGSAGAISVNVTTEAARELQGDARGLPMLLAPTIVIGLLLARRHLLEGLLVGILVATGLGLVLGLIAPTELLRIDAENFTARGLIVDGVGRGVGVSVFTFLLMGLVGGLEATGVVDRVVGYAKRSARTARGAELWIFGAVSGAVLLTTHSVVAILTVGRFARETGEALGIHAYRRANILDITVCTYPFLFPFFVPTILAASTTVAGAEFGMPRVSPWEAGLHNLHSWALLGVLLVAVLTGIGRAGTKR
jgi:Na+/H+ antiporter NhaC